MKKINLAIVPAILLLPALSWARCNGGAIIMEHKTGFGITGASSNSSDQQSINVPIGNGGCFKKKTNFALKVEDNGKKSEGKVVISPMSVEFTDVPAAHFKQYLYVERNPDISKVRFHTMAFICSGNIPLSIEAHSDMYAKIKQNSNQGSSFEINTVFATGKAAENLRKQNPVKSSQPTFDVFLSLFRQKTNRDLEDMPQKSRNVPNMIMASTIDSMGEIERQITDGFTTMGSRVINGCSQTFTETMAPYLIENFRSNPSLSTFKVNKKLMSNTITIEWKN